MQCHAEMLTLRENPWDLTGFSEKIPEINYILGNFGLAYTKQRNQNTQ